jgi:hypothetical protein
MIGFFFFYFFRVDWNSECESDLVLVVESVWTVVLGTLLKICVKLQQARKNKVSNFAILSQTE